MWLNICILLLSTLSGCCSYRVPTAVFKEESVETSIQHQALDHWLYEVIPRHRCQIQWYDVGHWCSWMLFGNDDDGIFGEEITAHYHPEWPISFKKACGWTFRNPFHNFCWYVIGSAYRENSEFTFLKMSKYHFSCLQYHSKATVNFPSKNSCLFLALHGGKPFLSCRWAYSKTGKLEFYLGWRCRGNFGLAFRLHSQ